jgi:radical SAM protein with 4Fe4S-binding SPASM domain
MVNLKKEKEISKADMRKKVEAWKTINSVLVSANAEYIKSLQNILIEKKVHKVSISIHSFENGDKELHKKYLSEVSDFAVKASKNGIIVVLRLWNNGCDDGKNDDAIGFLKENIQGEWIPNSKGIRINDKLFLEYGERFDWPDKNIDVISEKVFCYGLKDHFGILCDGTVVPCCLDCEGVINLGNIFEDDINAILNSDRVKKIVEGFNNRKASEELCKKCGYAQRF